MSDEQQPQEPELEDWNAYAEVMQRRALARLLGLTLRKVLEGKLTVAFQLLKVVMTVETEGGLGKQEFMIPLQRYFGATPAETRQELELLKEERTIEQLILPLAGGR